MPEASAPPRAIDADFRLFAENLPILCWMADADGYIFWYNRRWHDYCGSTAEAMAGWGWQAVHDAASLPTVLDRWTASIRDGEPFEMTFPLRAADGSFRPFLTRVRPLRDDNGNVLRWFGVNTDISDQVRAETELEATLSVKEMLLHEVNHRVKNSLQLVTSLLMLQAGNSASPELKQSLLEARSRIAVVAAIHRRLYETERHDRVDVAAYIHELARETIVVAGRRDSIELAFVGVANSLIPLSIAVPLALITSELLTNAVKYAFVDRISGTITISITVTGEQIELRIGDDGCGLPPGFTVGQSQGLGLRLVGGLIRQVRGTFKIIPQEAGACFSISVTRKD